MSDRHRVHRKTMGTDLWHAWCGRDSGILERTGAPVHDRCPQCTTDTAVDAEQIPDDCLCAAARLVSRLPTYSDALIQVYQANRRCDHYCITGCSCRLCNAFSSSNIVSNDFFVMSGYERFASCSPTVSVNPPHQVMRSGGEEAYTAEGVCVLELALADQVVRNRLVEGARLALHRRRIARQRQIRFQSLYLHVFSFHIL